jgi:carbon monoxide dehydrogenase subunit G
VKIEGNFVIDAPPDRVWPLITDPARVAPCIPGCENVEIAGPNAYKAAVKVALGPIKTTFNMTVEVTEQSPPHRWVGVTRGEEGGKASSLSAQSTLELVAVDGGKTDVRYSSDVSIFGRLGKFGLGMMKKRAEAMAEDFTKAFADVVAGADA